jgi:hypothetical protein
MNFFDQKELGNHLLQLCPKVVRHSVYEAGRGPRAWPDDTETHTQPTFQKSWNSLSAVFQGALVEMWVLLGARSYVIG